MTRKELAIQKIEQARDLLRNDGWRGVDAVILILADAKEVLLMTTDDLDLKEPQYIAAVMPGLSMRTVNCLRAGSISTVEHLVSINDLLCIRNFGRKSLDELRRELIRLKVVAPLWGLPE
jgi:DNA-directed RNA polymerase alpha subunit